MPPRQRGLPSAARAFPNPSRALKYYLQHLVMQLIRLSCSLCDAARWHMEVAGVPSVDHHDTASLWVTKAYVLTVVFLE